MAIQPTRQEADSTGTLSQYAHLYDVEDEAREREKADSQLSEEIAREVEERKKINVIAPLNVNSAATSATVYGVAIGEQANVGNLNTAIGAYSSSYHNQSVAIGSNSISSRDYEVAFGNSVGNVKRFVAFVRDPELSTDAATKNYVDKKTVNASSDSITVVGNKAKLNPSIFSDGLTATDAQVSLDMGFVGEHLAGDGLYYDSTDGLQVKVGDGLSVSSDGTLSVDGGASSGTEIIAFNQTLDKTGFACTGYFTGYLRKEATQGGTATIFTPIKASLVIQLTAAFASGTNISIPDLSEFSYQASVEDVYQVNEGYGTGNYVMSIEGNYTGSVDTNRRKIYLYSALPSGTIINLVK